MIENSTSNVQNTSKTSIRRDVISDWIIQNSILSKALEGKQNQKFIFNLFIFISIGNIDQNQYVDKVRTLLDFIAPKISKEEIETIWKMQVKKTLF
jgi:hypothetical protein